MKRFALLLLLCSCGHSSSSNHQSDLSASADLGFSADLGVAPDLENPDLTVPTFTVGGKVTGLSGTVVLQDNGGDDLTITSDGTFAFSTGLEAGAVYQVTVLTQPTTQTCVATMSSGYVADTNVTSVVVTCTDKTTTLTTSVDSLALSVTGLVEYGVAGTPSSGLARTIAVTNTGSYAASKLTIAYPTWPLGTTASSTCGSSLAAGGSCTITITPGSTATSACSTGMAPTPGAITIGADNANSIMPTVVVLGYGCLYQAGYVYALDDTTPASMSVGGRVATTTDQSTGVVWSSDGAGTFDGGVSIYGISASSTVVAPNPASGHVTGQAACNGSGDGTCDTSNLYTYYQGFATGAPINLAYYAAGLCKQTLSGHSDWYLPAICEMGYDTFNAGTGCGGSVTPTMQNMQAELVDLGANVQLSGLYWSATESSAAPQTQAWVQRFGAAGGSSQLASSKGTLLHVRCARAF